MRQYGHGAVLQAARGADASERAHQESEVEAGDVHEESFQNVRVPAQVHSAHRPVM